MSILVDRRDDGSLAVYYDGDLQFDSRDEAIYHAALVRPALAVAEARAVGSLHALVLGGGDGLAARDLLRSSRLAHLSLIDLDSAMIDLARGPLAALNCQSLDDRRVHVVVGDAWHELEAVLARRREVHLVLVDLTVPRDLAGARFHTIDWYERLCRGLGRRGVVAVNAASPSGRPDAYWSIVNSMRAARLNPVPFRIKLPSFAARGYGDDWGFVLGSPCPIAASELGEPRLTDCEGRAHPAHLWREAFRFPAASAERQARARPTRLGSHLLLHYLINSKPLADATGAEWDCLETALLPSPAADKGQAPLPPELVAVLAAPIARRSAEEALLGRVLSLMPALHPDQTRDMIAAFVAAPNRFLAALDVPGLVDRLLRRAAELPLRLVGELRALRRLLVQVGGDPERLLGLGLRVITIVTLVVIVANLALPDAVYGKGGDPGSGAGSAGGYTTSLASTSRSAHDPRTIAPVLASGSGYRASSGGRLAVDEEGTAYPARHYSGLHSSSHYRSSPSTLPPQADALAVVDDDADGVYRLTPDTDILADGRVVTALTDDAYVVIGPQTSLVVDQRSRQPVITLDREPTQVWRAVKEIERQRDGLKASADAKRAWLAWLGWLAFAPWQADDERELANLDIAIWRLERARATLGSVTAEPPPPPAPPVANASELISSIWMLADGSGLALRRPEGLAILDGKAWYRDIARQNRLTDAYPDGFRALMAEVLTQKVRDQDAARSRLESEVALANEDLADVLRDKDEYDEIARTEPPTTSVEYGTKEIPLQEAQRLTNAGVAQAQARLANLQTQIARLPAEAALAGRTQVSLRP